MNYIALIGAGGHTRSSINLLKQHFPDICYSIYDDSFKSEQIEYINNIKISGKISAVNTCKKIFLSIGNNKLRAEYFSLFNTKILKENLIHKTAFLEENIELGVSNQVFAMTYINSNVHIGDNNILNSSVVIEHEVIIGSHNHISVGAKICGRVSIGNNCFIGAGAIVIDKISICDNVIIGAGAVVIKNINKPGTYIGNPIRKVR